MKTRGITFIEIIISIAIISVLTSIVTIKVKNYLLRAKDMKVEADLEVLRAASNFYYNEQNRALGDSDVNTGSGIPKGESVEYKVYGDSKNATAVTYNHIQELIDKKYLEREVLKKMSFFKDASNSVKLFPGVNGEAQSCVEGSFKSSATPREVTLVFSQDNVKINFWDGIYTSSENGDGNIDSKCEVWNTK